MKRINQTNTLGLEAELTTLRKSFEEMIEVWENDEVLVKLQVSEIRINPLVAEQHAASFLGFTVVQSSDVQVGKVQLISVMPLKETKQ